MPQLSRSRPDGLVWTPFGRISNGQWAPIGFCYARGGGGLTLQTALTVPPNLHCTSLLTIIILVLPYTKFINFQNKTDLLNLEIL